MDLVGLAIALIVIIAVLAIGYWFLKASGLPIPQPVLIALYAIVAIVCILVVVHYAGIRQVW